MGAMLLLTAASCLRYSRGNRRHVCVVLSVVTALRDDFLLFHPRSPKYHVTDLASVNRFYRTEKDGGSGLMKPEILLKPPREPFVL